MSRLLSQTVRPYGIVGDVPPHLADPNAWNWGRGIDFDDQRSVRQEGYVFAAPAPLHTPERLLHTGASVPTWYYAGSTGLGMVQGGAHNDVTPIGWPAAPQIAEHSLCALNDVPVWNHHEADPHYHDGNPSNPFVPLPGWPAGWRCQIMRSFKAFLVACNITDGSDSYPNEIRWSASADAGSVPAEWVPSPSNDAGDRFFAATPGPVVEAWPMGDDLVIYKPESTYLLQYIGGVDIFLTRKLFQTSGIVAAHCVKEWRGGHFVVTQGDILFHDGSRAESIADQVVRREVFDGLDASLAGRAFVLHDPDELAFYFYYPTSQSNGWCNQVCRWNYRDDKWSVEDNLPDELSHGDVGRYTRTNVGATWDSLVAPLTWDTWGGTWDEQGSSVADYRRLLASVAANELIQPIDGTGRDGEPVDARLQWLEKDFAKLFGQSAGMITNLAKIWIDCKGPAGLPLSVRVGFSDRAGLPIAWEPASEFVVGTDEYVTIERKGRLVSLEISVMTASDFEITSLTFDFRLQGSF